MTKVYYENFVVAEIGDSDRGAVLNYDRRWIISKSSFPISLTMPLSEHCHQENVVIPWLANLLPEAGASYTIAQKYGVSPQDVIGMLRIIGDDTAGAMSIGSPRDGNLPSYRPIEDNLSLERIIEELPAKPFLVGDEGVSMSLAGVQQKLPLSLVDGQMCIPIFGSASTHILKPDDPKRLYGSVHNEALCLILAQLCGLQAADVTTGKAGERYYLLVTRYDRRQASNGRWLRIHQEDFCQALGKPPSAKYEKNQLKIKGPKLEDMFSLIRRHLDTESLLRFLDAVIFNLLICNTDAHAKNFSILLLPQRASLAPLYDLMCANCWDGITPNMAQSIAGQTKGTHVHGRHWQRMARDCGLNPAQTLVRVQTLTELVLARLPMAVARVAALPAGPHPMLPNFADAIERRCRTVLVNLADQEGGRSPRK